MLMSFGNNIELFSSQHLIGRLRRIEQPLYTTNQSNASTQIPTSYDRCDIANAVTAENIAFAVFIGLVLLASIIGNTMVLVASFMIKQLRSRPTVYFIASLAVSDVMFAISVGPFAISMKFYQTFCHGLGACYWMILSDSFCNVASILNLFLIAIDRFIAIKMPFRYSFILPPKRAKILICLIWIFSACWSISGLFMWEKSDEIFSIRRTPTMSICTNKNQKFYTASFLGIYLVPLCIMTVTYISILHIALRQIKAIEATHVEIQSMDPTPVLPRKRDLADDIERHRRATQRKRRKEIKATKSVGIVYFAFLICWFPSLVINLIIMYNNTYFPELRQTNVTLFLFIYYTFVQILPMINTMSNPLIYSFSNKQFQKAFKSLGYRFIGKRFAYPDSPNTCTQRPSRDEHANVPYSPSTSCSSQSFQSINNPFPWSPTLNDKNKPNLQNLKGAYANTSIDSEMISTNSGVAIWKPD